MAVREGLSTGQVQMLSGGTDRLVCRIPRRQLGGDWDELGGRCLLDICVEMLSCLFETGAWSSEKMW